MSGSTPESITYEALEATDVISVELVPERKGLILKHCEYYVSSRKHGTTVSRRYNDFVQLYDILYAKYPYRAPCFKTIVREPEYVLVFFSNQTNPFDHDDSAGDLIKNFPKNPVLVEENNAVCRLPPKRVVVGGGSPKFLQRRRAALQRWLTLVARHPVLAHDADVRAFLCEAALKLDRPRHDEFTLAGTTEDQPGGLPTEEMEAAFALEQEQLRLMQLGLCRLYKIFERATQRVESERGDIRELSLGLSALPAVGRPCERWSRIKAALRHAVTIATEADATPIAELDFTEEGPGGRLLLALDALEAYRSLSTRLTRGLHGERAAAASSAPHSAASQLLRARHRYSLRRAIEEAHICGAYALSAVEALPPLCSTQGRAHATVGALWTDLSHALRHSNGDNPAAS